MQQSLSFACFNFAIVAVQFHEWLSVERSAVLQTKPNGAAGTMMSHCATWKKNLHEHFRKEFHNLEIAFKGQNMV